jgi:hypothetical protein
MPRPRRWACERPSWVGKQTIQGGAKITNYELVSQMVRNASVAAHETEPSERDPCSVSGAGSGTAAVVAVKVVFPMTSVKVKATPVVGKGPEFPNLKPVIGPMEVVRSYVPNAALPSESISRLFEGFASVKPAPGPPKKSPLVIIDFYGVGKGNWRTGSNLHGCCSNIVKDVIPRRATFEDRARIVIYRYHDIGVGERNSTKAPQPILGATA